ncbi:hypothetical protein LTR86_010377 [Recurvomyces mirabilis]|nr:hypothetical protein LTR86_010377 [Recurvomyces mirabilis]
MDRLDVRPGWSILCTCPPTGSDYFGRLLMLCASIHELVHMITITIAWRYGLGRHFTALSAAGQRHSLERIILVETFSIASSTFGRISFAVFFLQIIGPHQVIFRNGLYTVIGVQALANLVSIVQIYAQCGMHARAIWDAVAAAAYGHCQDSQVQSVIGYIQSALNSGCDAVLTIIPVLVLWDLQMPRNQKLSLGCALTLSVFALGASIARCVEIRSLSQKGNITWYFIDLMLCVVLENNVVIVAASIPTLRPLVRKQQPVSGYPEQQRRTDGGNMSIWPSSQRRSRSDYVNGEDQSVPNDLNDERDDRSETHILAAIKPPDGQILKTTKFQVTYEEQHDRPRGF